ncbi:MAG TPA: aminotransferase class I/II-fold pyridoxal phosphate-dependent enzyme [Stellaceae bacterium]|nr:aminotransferase class I/II-fold pyridoxal phosphate-dependent enzyme [Stellaceae bacterium]
MMLPLCAVTRAVTGRTSLEELSLPANARLARLADNPFARLGELLADVTPRTNESPILMSVGEPQHPPPALLARTVAEYAHLWNRYPPMAGTPEYRAACAAWLSRRYHLPAGMVSGDRHVLALAGTKEGLYMAAALAVPETKAGATPLVLLPNPYYLVYLGGAVMAGAETVPLDATAATGFLPHLDALTPQQLERCALLYLCSPANPQGAIADLAYLEKAIALARAYDFVLVVDECYGEIYDRAPPPGALEACARMGGALDNVLVFHSLSKRSNAAGLRCGFVAGDPELIARFQHLRSYGGAQVPLPLQHAATALWQDEEHVEPNRELYRRKFTVAEEVLGRRFGFYRPPGGFFLWLDVGDGEQAAKALWREAGVRTLPGAYVARPTGRDNPGRRYIRVALVHDDATVAAGMQRMLRVL